MRRLALLLTLLIPVFTFSQIINIPDDYPTIQQGINAASTGDTVLVDTGTYVENINFNGKNITVASHYLMTLDTSYITNTVIDGGQPENPDIGTVVTFNSGEDTTSIFCGFSVLNGTGTFTNESWNMGGGIICSESSPQLISLMIRNNTAEHGGGIVIGNSNPILKDVIIKNNEADAGGGIECASSNPKFQNVIIQDNMSYYSGGGIVFVGESPIMVNVKINGNSSWMGGGINCYDSNPSLINVSINGNEAVIGTGGIGGGIALTNSNPFFVNVSMSENFAGSAGGGIYLSSNSQITLVNSILWDNNPKEIYFDWDNDSNLVVTSYCDIKGGIDSIAINNNGEVNWLEGNIDQDPLFVNSGDHPYQINDYSPCIETGTPDTTGLNLPEYDLAGEVRIFNDRVDMGAYEWNTFVGIEEPSMPETKTLHLNNFPNPFSSSTTIEYQLDHPSDITIHIFNHLGELVDLIQLKQSQGKQQIIWNAESQPAGIYYFRLNAGEQVASGKVVLVK